MRQLSRRAALALGTVLGAGGAVLTIVGWGEGAFAAAKEAADEIAKFTGGKTAEKGKISIELPEIAENGNTVPLSVAVDAPMTADNYVSEVLVVAEGNPNPGVATFHFSRRCRARRKPRPASGSPPRRTSSWSPRPARASSSPARSW